MKYERFEDLPVWNSAIDLGHKVFALTEHPMFDRQGDLRSQIRRAALSVSNNIAEGFERGSTNELLAFLYIARGSAGEVRSMLCFIDRAPWWQVEGEHRIATPDHISDLKSQISDFKSRKSGSKVQIPDLKSRISDLKSQFPDLKSQISDLKSLAESCSRQLRGWADHLQNTTIKGQRHLSDAFRDKYDKKKSGDAFWEQLTAVRDAAVQRGLEQAQSNDDHTVVAHR